MDIENLSCDIHKDYELYKKHIQIYSDSTNFRGITESKRISLATLGSGVAISVLLGFLFGVINSFANRSLIVSAVMAFPFIVHLGASVLVRNIVGESVLKNDKWLEVSKFAGSNLIFNVKLYILKFENYDYNVADRMLAISKMMKYRKRGNYITVVFYYLASASFTFTVGVVINYFTDPKNSFVSNLKDQAYILTTLGLTLTGVFISLTVLGELFRFRRELQEEFDCVLHLLSRYKSAWDDK